MYIYRRNEASEGIHVVLLCVWCVVCVSCACDVRLLCVFLQERDLGGHIHVVLVACLGSLDRVHVLTTHVSAVFMCQQSLQSSLYSMSSMSLQHV